MPLKSGMNASLGFATEASWGTYQAPTRHVPLVSWGVAKEIERLESAGIIAGRRVLDADQWAPGNVTVEGDVGLELYDRSIGLLFTHMFGAVVTSGSGPYCVDEDTEILTVDGWKRYDEVSAGDLVLTLDHDTGMSEWQPVQSMHVFPAEPRELVLMEGRGHSSLSTPNHRWPVVAPLGRQGRLGTQRVWKTTETLGERDRLVLAALCADVPVEAKWSDEFVELVAWFLTEGTIRPEGGVRITKTLARSDGEHVDRIDAALHKLFGPPAETGELRSDLPRWRRYTENGRIVRFALNRTAGDLFTHVAPERVAQRWFLRQLTQAQLELFVRTCMTDNDGPTRFVQKARRSAEAFQFAAILAGYGTSLLNRADHARDSWIVTLQRRAGCHPVMADRVARRQGREFIRRVRHDGIVWCPRTPNGTWLARRNGSVYFTGNTHTYTPGDLTGDGLTMQAGLPNTTDGTVHPFSALGCKVDEWEIACAAGEVATLGLSVVGKDLVTSQALVAPSYATGIGIGMTFVGASLTVGGVAYKTMELTLAGNNGLNSERRFLGDGTIDEPLEAALREYTAEISSEFFDLTMWDRFVNGTTAALVAHFARGTSTCDITMNVRFDGDTPEMDGPDVIPQTVPVKAIGDTDAAAITCVLTNSDATP